MKVCTTPTPSSLNCRSAFCFKAHVIRNRATGTAKAIASLHATCRWAVSGTPIQNRLSDFVALFKFLQFQPYDDPRTFDDDIASLWRENNIEEAVERVKRLFACVMLRRLKTTIVLPERRDKVVRIPFSREEEAHYRRIERPVKEMLDDATQTNSSGTTGLWVSAIQQINKLRIACNLGLATANSQNCRPPAPFWLNLADDDLTQKVIATRVSMGEASCEQCLQLIDLPVYYSRCGRLYCAACATLLSSQILTPCPCGSAVPCSLQPFLSAPAIITTPYLTPPSETSAFPSDVEGCEIDDASSKVRALVSDIRSNLVEKR